MSETPTHPRPTAPPEFDERLAILLEHNPVPMGIVGVADGRYRFCNAANERMLGFGPGEMTGRHALEVLDPSAVAVLQDALASTATGYQHVGLIPLRARDGRQVWCDAGYQRTVAGGEDVVVFTAVDATRRVEAERALARSERQLRDGFKHATVPTALLDATGVFTRVNPAFAALIGSDAATLAGTPLVDLISPNDPEGAAQVRARLETAGTPGSAGTSGADTRPLEVGFRRCDGGIIWARLSLVATGEPDQPPNGFLAEAVDRSELHATLDALRQSEERLSFALDATSDGLWDWDFASGELVINAQWAEMLGYAPEEIVPHINTWQSLAHPDDVPRAYAQLDEHAQGARQAVDFEMRMRHKDGSWRWIRNRAKIVARAPDGSPVRVVGTHADIHERKLIQEAMAAQALLLDTILSNVPIALDIVGRDGRFEYINRFLEDLLGWSLAELDDPTVVDRVFPDPAYRAKALQSIIEANPGPTDWTMQTRRGEERTVSWRNIRLPDGRSIGLGVDVTATRAAEAAEARLAQQMQQAQKLESLGLLAGGIAHDFNNLLVGVLGNASLAEELLPPGSEAQALVGEIRTAASRAADLTRQLLAYAGKGRFVVEPVDLSVLVGEMATLLRAAVSKQAALRQELAAPFPAVEADATQLRQVVMNLITNASDALGDGDGVITLRTGVLEHGDAQRLTLVGGATLGPGRHAFLEVSDTGAGMDAPTLARIFDPFFTTKTRGHGLGLAATLGIVRSHRGGIAVQSAPGRGTTITLYLPVIEHRARPSPTPLPGSIPTLRGSGTVLLADDEPAVRAVASRALERAGYTVVPVEDGAAAIAAFTADPSRFVGVVLDLTMPNVGGQDALRAIRAIRPDVPAVLCSGYSSEELDRSLGDLGHLEFVQKPFTSSRLIAAVFEATTRD